jgi:hypothetical protein
MLCLQLAFTFLLTPSVRGFLAPWWTRSSFIATSASQGGDIDDLEKARKQFTSTIGLEIQSLPEYYVPLPLTLTSRRRREAEIELLLSLEDSDAAIDDLVSMWMTERDAESARRLQEMENICSPGLIEEEAALRSMIAEYGLHWPEPASRLAALLYFKGNSEESMVWADRVLQVKPWHFEVLHLQRLNCLRLQSALLWRYARKALPPLNHVTGNAARHHWVNNAVNEAHQALSRAEAQLLLRSSPAKDAENVVWQ